MRDDQRLVAAFLAERRESDFRMLYRRHTPALYRCALRLSGGRSEEAEEVVQETWTRALRGLEGYRGASSLRTWLTGIALHCIRERDRRSGRSCPMYDDLDFPANEPDPGEPFDTVSLEELEGALERLPTGFRRVLVLHDVEGHTHETIARLLDIAPGTSKSQLSRARRKLRSLLASRRPGVELS